MHLPPKMLVGGIQYIAEELGTRVVEARNAASNGTPI
jgi:hypothetical protein